MYLDVFIRIYILLKLPVYPAFLMLFDIPNLTIQLISVKIILKYQFVPFIVFVCFITQTFVFFYKITLFCLYLSRFFR